MNSDKIIVVEYQDNFADNFSNYAYAKILSETSGINFCYENNPKKRKKFESKMLNFNMDFNYISSNRVGQLTKNAFIKNKFYIGYEKFNNRIKKTTKSAFLNLNHFRLEDIKYISEEMKQKFKFSDKKFIKSHDILEKINLTNSIGLYIDDEDLSSNNVDFDFILRAQKRLNKYLRKPKLFIFAKRNAQENIKRYIECEFIDFLDWQEEFYFLVSCKHKIILNSKNSYSQGLWSSIINCPDWGIIIYDKKISDKFKNKNWIGI